MMRDISQLACCTRLRSASTSNDFSPSSCICYLSYVYSNVVFQGHTEFFTFELLHLFVLILIHVLFILFAIIKSIILYQHWLIFGYVIYLILVCRCVCMSPPLFYSPIQSIVHSSIYTPYIYIYSSILFTHLFVQMGRV